VSLFTELKRRNVFRVAAAYIVTAWLVIQVVETIFPAFGFGDAAVRYVTIAFAVGLIPVLVLSWAFEWTPEGIKREAEVDDGAPASLQAARRFDRMILVVLALALGYFAFDKFVLEPQREAEEAVQQQAEVEEARQEGRTEALVESYGDKSIAVLPFRDMSPEGDQEYFSEGMAEELLNLLARVPELRVTSRTSAFAFKDQALEVPEIAKRLKVGHVLEGSVRKAGNTVRITAQLIEARSDTHLWSQTWDRELTNILAIQDEIAAAVAESLQTVLLGPVGSAAARAMTEAELQAYELVLQGRYLLYQASVDAYRRALPLYERAIEVAPDYAPAHAGLAKVIRQMMTFGALDREEGIPRMEVALERALELNPDDPDALATKGMTVVSPQGFEEAREYWRRAISINPNDADALRWLAWSYINVDSVRYLEYIERAYDVAPTHTLVSMWLAMALARFDRLDEALVVLGDWHALEPENSLPLSMAGNFFYQARQLDRALKSYYQVFRMAPEQADDEIEGLGWLIIDGLSMSSSELALRWAERRVANNRDSGTGNFQKIVFTWLSGGKEEAVRLLDELVERQPSWTMAPARFHQVLTRDYPSSREWWDKTGISEQTIQRWPTLLVLEYAFVLQQTGDPDRARFFIDTTLARIEEQLDAGVFVEDLWELNFFAGLMHAIRGENELALNYLRRDAANRGLSSVAALKIWPEFDGLRDDPEFQALIAEQEEHNLQWRQRLEEQGLLLTPEEVLPLEDFAFDPFAEVGSEEKWGQSKGTE
jgi:TolB-like protein